MELKFLCLKFAILDISAEQPMVGHVLKQRKWINCVIKEIKCCLAKAGWRLGGVCSLGNCFLLIERTTDRVQYPTRPKGGKSDLFLKQAWGLHCVSLDVKYFSFRHVFSSCSSCFVFWTYMLFCCRRSGSDAEVFPFWFLLEWKPNKAAEKRCPCYIKRGVVLKDWRNIYDKKKAGSWAVD